MKQFPADWTRNKYKNGAEGPIRNKRMLDEGAEIVYAFHPNLEQSKGTRNMINQALRRNIPVFHVK